MQKMETKVLDESVIIRLRKDGVRMYYKDKVLHRENGPAIENKDGSGEGYLFGVKQDIKYDIVAEEITLVEAVVAKPKQELKKQRLSDIFKSSHPKPIEEPDTSNLEMQYKVQRLMNQYRRKPQ